MIDALPDPETGIEPIGPPACPTVYQNTADGSSSKGSGNAWIPTGLFAHTKTSSCLLPPAPQDFVNNAETRDGIFMPIDRRQGATEGDRESVCYK
jgi:hypothetical protein